MNLRENGLLFSIYEVQTATYDDERGGEVAKTLTETKISTVLGGITYMYSSLIRWRFLHMYEECLIVE